jgi:internalin A
MLPFIYTKYEINSSTIIRKVAMNTIRRLFTILFITLFVFSCKKTSTGSDPLVVTIPDANFEALIREVLDKPTGDILDTDLEAITNIYSHNDDISNITGIEYCINLSNLGIDLSNISDINLLENLTNLQLLSFVNNDIDDIAALAGLINLEQIYLGGNQISNINALSGLTNLAYLNVVNNQITDIEPLVNNTGIDDGDEVWITDNLLNDTSIDTYIPQLIARGVVVNYDVPIVVTFPDAKFEELIRESLVKPTGDITNTDLRTIIFLNGDERDITNITGIEYCTNLEQLNLKSNAITDIAMLSSLVKLWYINLHNNYEITNINALASLTDLKYLTIDNSLIDDISPLVGLTNLYHLDISGNRFEDISSLANLTDLTTLMISSNALHSINDLSNLINLTTLDIHATQITDISPLTGLLNLTQLWIGDNELNNLNVLANLTALVFVHFANTNTSDISSLTGLTELTRLYIQDNIIADLSPLSGLNSLEWVFLSNNLVEDISPFVNNPGIGTDDDIWLFGNPLSTTSINTYVPQLEARGVIVHY